MISPAHAQLMARYNAWQNQSLYAGADQLSDETRRRDRGLFWRSVHQTLNHVLWGDQMWMSRFSDTVPAPEGHNRPTSVHDLSTWDGLKASRVNCDEAIVRWADGLTQEWLSGDLSWYSGAAQRDVTEAKWILVTHFFNHQTHHRGQVHGALTEAGAKLEDTDLFLMPR